MSSLGKRLIKAATEARSIARGVADPKTYRVHTPCGADVKRIRKGLGLSQSKFAERFHIPLGTLRDWEQDRRIPEGTASVLLTVIAKEPDAVTRALRASVA
jgi:putative transcriptional regulator